MLLCELFNGIDKRDLINIEHELDDTIYQPKDKVEKGKEPVIDLDLLSPHFLQRASERGKKAGITPEEIEKILKDGRSKFKAEIGQASRKEDFNDNGSHIDFFDQNSKIMIPTIVKPNEKCKPNSRGKITCQTTNGPAPKNKLIAKTIMRKGTDD